MSASGDMKFVRWVIAVFTTIVLGLGAASVRIQWDTGQSLARVEERLTSVDKELGSVAQLAKDNHQFGIEARAQLLALEMLLDRVNSNHQSMSDEVVSIEQRLRALETQRP